MGECKYLGNSFFLENSNKAVLLIHGFSSSTEEMEQLGFELYNKGYTVIAPLLAGHNTNKKDFSESSANDYYNSVLKAYDKIKNYDEINVVGLSFGAILALNLAIEKKKINKLILMSPSIIFKLYLARFVFLFFPFVKQFKKSKKNFAHKYGYDFILIKQLSSIGKFMSFVLKNINEINIPILVITSKKDRVVSYKRVKKLFNKFKSNFKDIIILENSSHLVTLDKEVNIVINSTLDFLKKN